MSGIREQLSERQNLPSAFGDVLSCKGLWLEIFNLLLDALDLLERVLLYDADRANRL
jgi:hypothetical protein